MNTKLTGVAGLVRLWTWLYTLPLRDELRECRRAEMRSHLWELEHDPSRPWSAAAHLFVSASLGVADDLLWCCEHLAIPRLSFAGSAPPIFAALTATLALVFVTLEGAARPGRSLNVSVTRSGWLVVGGEPSRVTMVPAVSVRFTSADSPVVSGLQVNALFGAPGSTRPTYGHAFLWSLDKARHNAGLTNPDIFLQPDRAWFDAAPTTSAADRPPVFPKSTVRLFIKHRGEWTLLGEYPIAPEFMPL